MTCVLQILTPSLTRTSRRISASIFRKMKNVEVPGGFTPSTPALLTCCFLFRRPPLHGGEGYTEMHSHLTRNEVESALL